MVALSASVSSGLVIAVWKLTGGWPPWDRVAFAPPLVCLSLVVGASLHLGLMGSDYADGAREWIARAGSMLALTCAGWAALFVMAIHAPRWAAWLLGEHGATGLTLVSGWVATTVAGVLVGRSARHQRGEGARPRPVAWDGSPPRRRRCSSSAMCCFCPMQRTPPSSRSALRRRPAGAAAATPSNRLTVDVRVPETSPAIEIDVRGPQTRGWLETTLEPVARFGEGYYDVLRLTDAAGAGIGFARPLWVLALLGGCVAITWIASRRININEFSLHNFYKNRLVRCYLGATQERKRKPNPLTGFDPQDDFPLSELIPYASTAYPGPHADREHHAQPEHRLRAGAAGAQGRVVRDDAGLLRVRAVASGRRRDTPFSHTTVSTTHGYRSDDGYGYPDGPRSGRRWRFPAPRPIRTAATRRRVRWRFC